VTMSDVDKITTAIARNNLSALRKLVSTDEANLKDEDGVTLLVNAILGENVGLPVLQFLIDQGADVNEEDSAKYTALHFAARAQRKEMVEALLKAGAKPDGADADGNTPLIHCVMSGLEPNREIVQLLLRHGADPKKKNRERESALDVARFAEDNELLSLLKSGVGGAKSPSAVAKRTATASKRKAAPKAKKKS
jgi:ankyrin repeat protein